MKKTMIAVLTSLLSLPALAAGIDWDSDPLTGARQALIDAKRENPISVPAARGVSSAAIEVYEGEMTVGAKRVGLRLRLSTRDEDQYAGDPDMSQGVFVSRQGRLDEEGRECATAWERNGDYLRECSGLFLTGVKDAVEKGVASGDVFSRLDRFDAVTGGLRVQPVGYFSLRRVSAASVTVAASPVGSDAHPYAERGDYPAGRVDAYLSEGHDEILAYFSTCDEQIDDCSGLRFVFQQLSVDLAGRTVKLGSEVVGTLEYDAKTAQAIKDGRFYFGKDGIDHAYGVRWLAGWTLKSEIKPDSDGRARVSVALTK